MKPWEKWTPEEVARWAETVSRAGSELGAEMLRAFAALLQAERERKRCVLPREVAKSELSTGGGGDQWIAWRSGHYYATGRGTTQQAAIEDLAAKIRGEG